MQGSRAGGGVGVHPAMLESEFLAATGAAEAGEEGGAVSLSLEEVPYDRDVRCVGGRLFLFCMRAVCVVGVKLQECGCSTPRVAEVAVPRS